MKKYLFIFLGSVCLSLAVMGIFVPGLPTTPLLLLSTWLYARSSEKLLGMVMRNKYLGNYLRSYHERGGAMTPRQKLFAISFMWVMVGVSVFLRLESNTLKYILIGVATIGTTVMGFVVPTYKKEK